MWGVRLHIPPLELPGGGVLERVLWWLGDEQVCRDLVRDGRAEGRRIDLVRRRAGRDDIEEVDPDIR